MTGIGNLELFFLNSLMARFLNTVYVLSMRLIIPHLEGVKEVGTTLGFYSWTTGLGSSWSPCFSPSYQIHGYGEAMTSSGQESSQFLTSGLHL